MTPLNRRRCVYAGALIIAGLAGGGCVCADALDPSGAGERVGDAHIDDDNLLLEDSPTTNYARGHINIGANATGRDRGLVRFDLSDWEAPVDSATLAFWVEDGPCRFSWDSSDCGYSLTVEAHFVRDSWSTTSVTWATQPTFDDQVLDSTSFSDDGRWVELDVTEAVVRWVEDGEPNHGLMLKSDERGEETGGGSVSIYMGSMDYPDSPRPAVLEGT